MIDPLRLQAVKNRLIELHTVLTQRGYPFNIFPSHLMTTEQIRDRATFTKEGHVNDTEFYERTQTRSMTIVVAVDCLDNVTKDQPLTVDNPHTNVIAIYETIQEYNSLWYELYHTKSGYFSINPLEMKSLERMSFYLYPTYKEIKAYLRYSKEYAQGRSDEALLGTGLAGLGEILSMPGYSQKEKGGGKGFISYYDLCMSDISNYNQHDPISAVMPYTDIYAEAEKMDSIRRREKAEQTYGSWN